MKVLIGSCLTCLLLYFPALGAPSYKIVPLGLAGPEHTRDDGYARSLAKSVNGVGQAVGHSDRYGGGTDLGYSAWLFNGATTIDIGLTGPEHTRSDGYKVSSVRHLNEAGLVSGHSRRFMFGNTELGYSAWLYNGAKTLDIGLTGPEYTRSDGYRASYPSRPNEAGQVLGSSDRYSGGSTFRGSCAWLYDGATTVDISLTGPEYTRSDGYRASYTFDLNEAGQVLGSSDRYNGGSTDLGRSAWLYDGATTIDIGLTGPEYTRSDGYKLEQPSRLNEAGQVSGYSRRYNGDSDLGYSAWLYDGATTIDIGLTGPEHTRSDGYRNSSTYHNFDMNEAGQVTGISERYIGGSTYLGQSTWLYDGANTIEVGLVGSEHTRDDGFRNNQFFVAGPYPFAIVNTLGQTVGSSDRYNGGSTYLGSSAWLYDGAKTIDVGLTGPEHTRSDGYKENLAEQLNEAGHVVGHASRFNNGSTDLGQTAWLYNGTTTIEIGLTGPEYIRNDGYKYSQAHQLNEAGQVVGYSRRYDSDHHDLWLYDPLLEKTFALRYPGHGMDFYYNFGYLGDDGLVLGSYRPVDGSHIGAFYFTIADGLQDLGMLVDGGLADNGWEYLADAIRANGLGQILGHGKLHSQSGGQMAYLLTPVVPEPNSIVLTALTSLTLFQQRRKKAVNRRLRRSGSKVARNPPIAPFNKLFQNLVCSFANPLAQRIAAASS